MEEVLKRYDKLLTFKKNLDGSVDILRKSPFDTQKTHKIFTITNQFIGSKKWIIKKLISMDTTRFDIVGKAMRNNWAIRNKKDSSNIHREIADFMFTGGSIFLN